MDQYINVTAELLNNLVLPHGVKITRVESVPSGQYMRLYLAGDGLPNKEGELEGEWAMHSMQAGHSLKHLSLIDYAITFKWKGENGPPKFIKTHVLPNKKLMAYLDEHINDLDKVPEDMDILKITKAANDLLKKAAKDGLTSEEARQFAVDHGFALA